MEYYKKMVYVKTSVNKKKLKCFYACKGKIHTPTKQLLALKRSIKYALRFYSDNNLLTSCCACAEKPAPAQEVLGSYDAQAW
jgi:hypothetical protein